MVSSTQVLAEGHGWERWGNFINAELWGRPTTLPWGVIFPGEAAQACEGVVGLQRSDGIRPEVPHGEGGAGRKKTRGALGGGRRVNVLQVVATTFVAHEIRIALGIEVRDTPDGVTWERSGS